MIIPATKSSECLQISCCPPTSTQRRIPLLDHISTYFHCSRFVKNTTSTSILSYLSTEDLGKLDQVGYVVKDGFLRDAAMIQAIRSEVEQMKETGGLKQAGMNQGEQQWRDKNIRGDLHAWLNDIDRVELQLPNLGKLLRKMDAIRLEMNAVCGFESPKCQTQVACYPGAGSRYVRHLDAFIGGANRRITVLYCTSPPSRSLRAVLSATHPSHCPPCLRRSEYELEKRRRRMLEVVPAQGPTSCG